MMDSGKWEVASGKKPMQAHEKCAASPTHHLLLTTYLSKR
jgi:hypothetical protein